MYSNFHKKTDALLIKHLFGGIIHFRSRSIANVTTDLSVHEFVLARGKDFLIIKYYKNIKLQEISKLFKLKPKGFSKGK